MNIPATLISERMLERHIPELLQSIGLTWVDKQVPVGSYKLDAIALDRSAGRIIVVELKTCAHVGTLGQLLLYRSALQQTIVGLIPEAKNDVEALLITTFLDREVVDVVKQLGLDGTVRIKVCVGGSVPFSLVDPSDAPDNQAWYQRGEPSLCLAKRIKGWDIV